MRSDTSRRRIAVVGSGVAGLTAAYILQREADVTLFEADSRLGGHAHTHDLADAAGRTVGVDTGFIVHNQLTYPNLLRLFAELDIATQPSEMSMSISCHGCGLEYAGSRGVTGLFPSSRNLVRPRYLYLLTEVLRFHQRARALLAADAASEQGGAVSGSANAQTVEQFLRRGRFSAYFGSHFVTPVVSAVWSCAPGTALQYPARYLFEFLNNHGMLSVTGSPAWRTVTGGSARYVERASKQLSAVLTTTAVRAVTKTADHQVEVRDDADELHSFDAVVVATHPHQALRLLTDPSPLQRSTLGAIGYSQNPTVLHSDDSVLPSAKKAQASWNYHLPSCDASADSVLVTYDMNRLQRLSSATRYLVTLNAASNVDPSRVMARMHYEHPMFTPASVAAQTRLPEISDDTIAFAGAYHGWGFHEDGCRSGVDAARSLGVLW